MLVPSGGLLFTISSHQIVMISSNHDKELHHHHPRHTAKPNRSRVTASLPISERIENDLVSPGSRAKSRLNTYACSFCQTRTCTDSSYIQCLFMCRRSAGDIVKGVVRRAKRFVWLVVKIVHEKGKSAKPTRDIATGKSEKGTETNNAIH